MAAERGDTEAIEKLIAGGADMEIRSSLTNGNSARSSDAQRRPPDTTPLCFAIGSGREQAVNVLLQLGANPNPPAPRLNTPIYMAIAGWQTNLVHKLVDRGAVLTNSPIVHMALQTMPGEIPFLLDSGADPNMVSDPNALPPLLQAVSKFVNERQKHLTRRGSSSGGTAALPAFPPPTVQNRTFAATARISNGNTAESGIDWEGIAKDMVTQGANVNAVFDQQTVLWILAGGRAGYAKPMEMIE